MRQIIQTRFAEAIPSLNCMKHSQVFSAVVYLLQFLWCFLWFSFWKLQSYFPSISSDIYCLQRKHCYSMKFSCFKYQQLQLFDKKTGLRYYVHITYLPRPIPFHHCSFPMAAMKLQNREWPFTQLTWFRNVLLLYLDRNDFLDVISHGSLFLAFPYFGGFLLMTLSKHLSMSGIMMQKTFFSQKIKPSFCIFNWFGFRASKFRLKPLKLLEYFDSGVCAHKLTTCNWFPS